MPNHKHCQSIKHITSLRQHSTRRTPEDDSLYIQIYEVPKNIILTSSTTAFHQLDLRPTGLHLLPPTTRNPIPNSTHVAALRLVSDLAGRVVRFPACARAAKLAFLRLISAAVGWVLARSPCHGQASREEWIGIDRVCERHSPFWPSFYIR
jgi:hypothetical protein